MTPINNNELQVVLLEVISKADHLDFRVSAALELAYDTGARFNEVLYLQEWQYDPGTGLVTYIAQKNETVREFPFSLLGARSQHLLTTNPTLIENVTYTRARNMMQRILSSRHLSYVNKKLHVHAFRHGFARRHFYAGVPLPTLQGWMGLLSANVLIEYVYGTIYRN